MCLEDLLVSLPTLGLTRSTATEEELDNSLTSGFLTLDWLVLQAVLVRGLSLRRVWLCVCGFVSGLGSVAKEATDEIIR